MIARESCSTHFNFVADIELYPSPNLIENFLQMIEIKGNPFKTVYVTPIFEIKSNSEMPQNKSELLKLIQSGSAQIFHKQFCAACHTVPNFKNWLDLPSNGNLSVFHKAKRSGIWEPIYIGTNFEPPYDERLSWDGRGDKMTQVSVCLHSVLAQSSV